MKTQPQKKPDLDQIYLVLREWALAGMPKTYGDLSRDYEKRTGEWFNPHGCWSRPLGELNKRLFSAGAPAISALVIMKATKQPGGNFWGCALNVPSQPKDENRRLQEWNDILDKVRAYPWPPNLP